MDRSEANCPAGVRPEGSINHLAEYLLRMPFSLQKIHWNESSKTVIYRSRKHWRTKRNFEVFQATDFIAAAVQHIPPKGQQTVRYYGLYSNKARGMADTDRPMLIPAPQPDNPQSEIPNPQSEVLLVPAPPKQTARALRPLWRDLIIRVWGGDPLRCPCCKATMKTADTLQKPEEIEFFLRLHGLWEGVTNLPRPPPPPFNVEKRRGLGGVLGGGEAGARRVSPQGGAGESNHGANPAAMARP